MLSVQRNEEDILTISPTLIEYNFYLSFIYVHTKPKSSIAIASASQNTGNEKHGELCNYMYIFCDVETHVSTPKF